MIRVWRDFWSAFWAAYQSEYERIDVALIPPKPTAAVNIHEAAIRALYEAEQRYGIKPRAH